MNQPAVNPTQTHTAVPTGPREVPAVPPPVVKIRVIP